MIGLVSCRELPEEDRDEALLIAALRERGASVRVVDWDDESVAWGELELAVLRSTWNYHLHHDAFLAWLDRASRATLLLNPPELVRWNSHKRYLIELAARGFPVTPTALVTRGSTRSLGELLEERGWGEVVIKPAVSGGSFETHRASSAGLEGGERVLRRLLAERDVLVQPYLSSVDGYGERSMIIIDGELTHAIRKSPRFSAQHESVSAALAPAADERELALSIWTGLPPGTLYGRVDLARDERGRPLVMELEVVEPSLFLAEHPAALERFAASIITRARLAITPAG